MSAGSSPGPFSPIGIMRSWLRLKPAPDSRPARGSLVAWLILIASVLYFFLPLVATLEYSLRPKPNHLLAYQTALKDPKFFSALAYSFVVGVITIVLSISIILPTAFWVRLRLPRLRSVVEFVTLLPFIIPAVVLVFGLLRIYSAKPIQLVATDLGSTAVLIGAYVVLSFPYMYRAVDTGLAAIDVRTLTEAAQSMGAGWGRILIQVILPNIRAALLAGAFLTLAIVIGEYTIATFLARPAFGPFLSDLGRSAPFEPAAVALISFLLTWLAMILIAIVGRGARTRVQVGGAR
ncbi:MAG TPA: ABC transporter permease subunit [Candidatus Polarisedimenticolia bacterium]|nr:ABC transporter permease subunit [Candidatus Polarisedimenticolia bacterium]